MGTSHPLQNPILGTLRWQATLFKKVFVVAPGKALTAVAVSILARIIRLLSIVLPLKTIMVAGSNEVPGFILFVFPGAEKGSVVLALCILSVVFYLLHVIAGRFFNSMVGHGGLAIARSANKISAKVNIEAETATQYRHVIRSVSAMLFVIVLLGVLATFYQTLALALVGLLATALIALIALTNWEHARDWLARHRVAVQERSQYVAALVMFVIIVIDVLRGDGSALLVAVIGLVVSRQILNSTSEYIRLAAALSADRDQVETLFFHKAPNIAPVAENPKELWHALTVETTQSAVREAVRVTTGEPAELADFRWVETGVPDIVSIQASRTGTASSGFLVKIYNSNRHLLCAHEELLLRDSAMARVPAPRLIGRTEVSASPCLVFETSGEPIASLFQYRKKLPSLLAAIWGVPVPANLLGPFRRTTPCGVSGLTDAVMERILLAATPDDIPGLREMRSHLVQMTDAVLAMPMALQNPEISSGTVAQEADGSLVATHWGRWGIEPVGSGLWDISDLSEAELASVLGQLARNRRDCRNLSTDQLQLAGLLYAFWKQFQRQKYRAALDAVPGILQHFKAAQAHEAA